MTVSLVFIIYAIFMYLAIFVEQWPLAISTIYYIHLKRQNYSHFVKIRHPQTVGGKVLVRLTPCNKKDSVL